MRADHSKRASDMVRQAFDQIDDVRLREINAISEVECVIEWARAVWGGALNKFTVADLAKFRTPGKLLAIVPFDATADQLEETLRAFRRFFHLPGDEPDIVRPVREAAERSARLDAKALRTGIREERRAS